jgi:hypothetical protein
VAFSVHAEGGRDPACNDRTFSPVKKAARVESRLVGASGKISPVFHAYRNVSACNKEFFIKLSKESSTNAGKTYALIWLFDNDKESYETIKTSMDKNGKVHIQAGCALNTYSMEDVFKKIESGELQAQLGIKNERQ